jgi:hypothetical protein
VLTELPVGVLEVLPHRARAYPKEGTDLVSGEAVRDLLQDLALSRRDSQPLSRLVPTPISRQMRRGTPLENHQDRLKTQ